MSVDIIYYMVVDENHEPTIKVVSNPSDDAQVFSTPWDALQARASQMEQRKRALQDHINRINTYLRKLADLWMDS